MNANRLAPGSANSLRALNFRHPFRKYQRMILEQVASGKGDHKHHIVAPPGSGKTIVGIELIRRLIQALVDFGVKTVVLDECHHLLDYWAIVLRHLIRQIDRPNIVGLTATLPSPEGDKEFENYDALLGEVDFEVPTPAVVKEGDLAPYRDLVYFVEPSRRESNYLNHVQAAFEAAIAELTQGETFRNWVVRLILERPGGKGDARAWESFLSQYPLLSLAGLRFLKRVHYPPAYHPVPRLFSVRKELAESFGRNWERYVGGGELVFTRSESGHKILLRARAQKRPRVKSLAFEIWR